MSERISLYRAYFWYQSADPGERTIDIFFTAPDPMEAVRSAYRFWVGRNKNMPGHFRKVFCLKVVNYEVGPIAEDGMLTNPGNFDFFEYKYDTAGLPLAEYVEYRCSEFDRRLRK